MSPPNITDQSHKNNRADIEMFFGESSEFSDSETMPDDSLRKSEQPEVINGINTLDNLEREFYMKFAKYVLGYTCGNCMCCKEIKLMSKLFEINSIILGHRKSIENHDSSFAAEGSSTSSVQIMKESPSSQSTIEKENVSCHNKNEVEELQILQSNDDIFDQNDSTNLNKTSSASKKRGKKRKTIDIFKPKIKKNSNKHVAERKQSVNKQIELASTSDDQSMDEVQNGTSETISKQKNLKQGKKRKSATIYKGHVKKKSNKSVKKAYVPEIDQCNDEEIEVPNKNMSTELNEANNDHFNEILEELRQKRASKLLEEKENSQNTSLSITTSDQKENISDTEDAGARGETLNLTRRKDLPMSKYSRQKLDFSSPNLELTKKKRETQREKAITSNPHNSRGPLSRKKSPKKTSQKRKPLYSPENWLNSNDFTKMCASV